MRSKSSSSVRSSSDSSRASSHAKSRGSNTSGSNERFGETDLIAIFGRRGSGKSTLCQTIQHAYPRTIVFDLLHEYNPRDFDFTVNDFRSFGKKMVEIAEKKPKKYKILVRFDVENAGALNQADHFFKVLYYLGNCALVVEEIHMYMQREHLPHWLKNLILLGRHRKVAIIATSQRPAEVSKTFIAQCQHVFAGVFFEKNDLKYLTDTIHTSDQVLNNIKPFTFYHYRPGVGGRMVKNR